jgi:hypothetical protein
MLTKVKAMLTHKAKLTLMQKPEAGMLNTADAKN